MCPEPLRHGVGGAVGQQHQGPAALQIDSHSTIRLAFAQRKIVYPEYGGGGESRHRQPAQHAQQGVAAYHKVPLAAEVHAGRASQGHAERDEALGEPQGAPGPGGGHGGRRSVKMRRRQWRLWQNHLRTRSRRRTRYSAHGRSARARS
jgi:hypothetical protein